MNKSQVLMEKDRKYLMQTYARYPVVIDHGYGATLWDPEGRRYIDFSSGIGVCSLGYGNPHWVDAVTQQASKLAHISNLFYSEPYILLAEALCTAAGMDRVFFSNSGAESNEGAIKLARKYSFDRYGPGRHTVITLVNSFHGRTITTLKATGQEKFHQTFFPFTEGFRYAQAGDLASLESVLDDDVCAILVEGVQGEGGVLPLSPSYLQELRALCDRRDLLLIADEVQTGIGRTGQLFAYQTLGYRPDVITVAKGLAGGLPMGAVLASGAAAEVLNAGSHGSTFGGNPICAAAALAVLKEVQALLPQVAEKGTYLRSRIEAMNAPCVTGTRGLGLMIGVPLEGRAAGEVNTQLVQNGLLCLTAGFNTLRLLPPLSITREEMDLGLAILENELTGGN